MLNTRMESCLLKYFEASMTIAIGAGGGDGTLIYDAGGFEEVH